MLYEQIYQVAVLERAWRAVRRSKTPGPDKWTVKMFERDWPRHMAELARSLEERTYHPLPAGGYVKRKPDGGQRQISILSLRDRVVQRAVLEVVRPVFALLLSPAAFGAMPGRGMGAALSRAEVLRRDGLHWVVRTDIKSFFDDVEHERVLTTFRAVTRDASLTALVQEWLDIGLLHGGAITPVPPTGETPAQQQPLLYDGEPRAEAGPLRKLWRAVDTAGDVMQRLELARSIGEVAGAPPLPRKLLKGRRGVTMLAAGAVAGAAAGGAVWGLVQRRGQVRDSATEERSVRGGRGTPQGAPLSPLLATSILSPFDEAMDAPPKRGLVRYIDDMAILCPTEAHAHAALEETRQRLDRLGLRLNEAKTEVLPYDAGFTFLGAELPRMSPRTPADMVAKFRNSPYWHYRQMPWDKRR